MIRRSTRLADKKQPIYTDTNISAIKKIKRKLNDGKIISESKQEVKKVSLKTEKDQIEDGTAVKVENEMIKSEFNSLEMFVGGHTSISGGVWKAVEEATAMGAKAFGLFLRNQQQWQIKPLIEGHAEQFREACKEHDFSPKFIVPHGSYLMNCGSFKEDVREKSHHMLIEELKRCEALGLLYFNFHPGSTLGKMPVPTCLAYIASAINEAHKATKYAIPLLENMSCQGNTVGGKLEELRDIINQVDDKSRVGVCIDTCHAHAAGYDLSTVKGFESLMKDLEFIIGLKYLKAMHINDSKGPSGCHKDRHENIGRGTIGLNGFRRIMNDPRLSGIPMILETPFVSDDVYKKEIKLLYSLQK